MRNWPDSRVGAVLHPAETPIRTEDDMEYRNLGRSGLKVSPLCLGTMMFGGRDRRAERDPHHRPRHARPGSTSSTPRTSTPTADRRRSSAGRSRPTATAGCWRPRSRNRDGPGPNEGGLSRQPGLRRRSRTSLRRLGTDCVDILLPAQGGPGDAARRRRSRRWRDLIRAGKSAISASPTSAAGGSPRSAVSATQARHRPAGRQPAATTTPMNRQPEVEHLPACAPLRPRRRALQPARARRADRQIPPGEAPPAGHARRAAGQAHAGDRVAAGKSSRSPQSSRRMPRARGMTPGHFALAWVLNNRIVTAPDRRPAHRGAVERLSGGARLPLRPPRTRRWSTGWCAPGHASTPATTTPPIRSRAASCGPRRIAAAGAVDRQRPRSSRQGFHVSMMCFTRQLSRTRSPSASRAGRRA